MQKENVTKALEVLKSEKKRKFSQTYDLIITLKDIDVKTQQLDSFVTLPHSRGKKIKVCALVGQELDEQAKQHCELVIRETDFPEYKADPKKIKKLAQTYDFFIAQSTLMPQVAQVFGRALGPRGRMPNPKAGCVVAPGANLSALKERLQKTIHVKAKTAPMMQCLVGSEEMTDTTVTANVVAVIQHVTKMLPSEAQNLNVIYLKKTMSKVVKV